MNKGICKEKKKKKREKRKTTKQGLRPVEAAASRLPTQSPIMPSSYVVASSSFFFFFFFLSFFRWWRSLCNSSFLLNTTAMCSLSFLCYSLLSFEFLGLSRDMHWNDERFWIFNKSQKISTIRLRFFFICQHDVSVTSIPSHG